MAQRKPVVTVPVADQVYEVFRPSLGTVLERSAYVDSKEHTHAGNLEHAVRCIQDCCDIEDEDEALALFVESGSFTGELATITSKVAIGLAHDFEPDTEDDEAATERDDLPT